jgi:hypothetical protein
MIEPCAIHFKSPLIPLFQRGRLLIPLFGKEGPGEIYGTKINAFAIVTYKANSSQNGKKI